MGKIDREVVFVDFFDTIMFRKVHPFQVYDRWAVLLQRWMGETVTAKELLRIRSRAASRMRSEGIEVNWRDLYGYFYDELSDAQRGDVGREQFVDTCHRMEVDVEIGVQYPHTHLLKRLGAFKKRGGRIYVVSDFHLDKDDLTLFLKAKHVDVQLFDDIYVSADCGCSKAEGSLYQKVLQELAIEPQSVMMIGDNPVSDGKKAETNGIKARIEHNYWEKMVYQIRRRVGYDYTKHAFSAIEKMCRRYGSPYSEYALLFQFFSRRLYQSLVEKGAHHITFFSREGHYLKRSFDSLTKNTPPTRYSQAIFSAPAGRVSPQTRKAYMLWLRSPFPSMTI